MRTLLTIAFCLATVPSLGQEVRVRVAKEKPPHYVNRPAVIQFTVEGFDQDPAPTVEVETPLPPGLQARTVVGSPRVVSGYSNINGRFSQYMRVTHVINYVVTATKPGDYVVGPFVLKQGAKQADADSVSMSFEAVPEDPDMRVRLILPEGNVYPDQRVPVKIEWCYAGDSDDIQELTISSPLFDQFRFAPDPEPRQGDSRLPILTKDGRIGLAASVKQEERDGRPFIVVTATRTMIPDRVGEYKLEPITAMLEKATSWTRDRSGFDGFGSSLLSEMMGGGRRPASTAIGQAVGKPRTLVVKPFPLSGKPESFAGAVGDGFSIDVAADRTVVRVGDPIRLDITLRGRGNLENASLPPLSADGGLNPDHFRLPEGDVPGTMTDGAKEFDVSVRVSDESVGEIPALAYSWFDPTTETYHTARSKPIALRVMATQVISADDVVSKAAPSRQSDNAGRSGDDDGNGRDVATATPKTPKYSLSGADLAIEPLAGVVLRNEGHWTAGLPLQLGIYGAGFLLIVVALVDRRRKDVAPALIARRRNIRNQQERIGRTARLPQKEAASEIADAMRALVAELPDVARDEAQAVIASCESIVFAPDASSSSRLDSGLIDRAKEVASRFRHSSTDDSV